ncbi:MAG: hypothetical protein J5J00_06970 [Deltaproteobacteria bacterium]|nr:hypothetical protein [Deltaproteobacteria bacterium]
MTSTSSNIMRDIAWNVARSGDTAEPKPRRNALASLAAATHRVIASIKERISLGKTPANEALLTSVEPRNRFMEAVKRIELCHAYAPTITPEAPYGYFRGRPIIGELTRINGGIYVGALPHESIVVDAKYGSTEKIVKSLMARCEQIDPGSTSYEYEVFSKVVAITRETLRYSEEGVHAIERVHNIQPDDKVTLDVYIKRRVGVSRHQVLLAAFLLEKVREEGMIKGRPSIEGIISPETLYERLLFSSADGEVFRFDPTKGLGKTAIH